MKQAASFFIDLVLELQSTEDLARVLLKIFELDDDILNIMKRVLLLGTLFSLFLYSFLLAVGPICNFPKLIIEAKIF